MVAEKKKFSFGGGRAAGRALSFNLGTTIFMEKAGKKKNNPRYPNNGSRKALITHNSDKNVVKVISLKEKREERVPYGLSFSVFCPFDNISISLHPLL